MKRYTIKELIDLDIMQKGMNVETMIPLTKQILTYANNRRRAAMEALERRNIPTPQAYRESYELKNRSGDIVKAKTWRDYNFSMPKKEDGNYLQSLKETYAIARKFLMDKSSTIKGWEKTLVNFRKSLREGLNLENERGGIKNKEDTIRSIMKNFNEYWEIYNYVAAELGVGKSSSSYDSGQAQTLTTTAIKMYGFDRHKILEMLRANSEKDYKTKVIEQGGTEDYDELGGFYMDNNSKR